MQPFIPSTIAVIFKNIKVCKDVYNILVKNENQSNQFLNGKMRVLI